MRSRTLFVVLLIFSLLITACGLLKPQITTVIESRIIKETQIITAEVTRVVKRTKLVTVEVTHVIRETVIILVEPTKAPEPPAATPMEPTGVPEPHFTQAPTPTPVQAPPYETPLPPTKAPEFTVTKLPVSPPVPTKTLARIVQHVPLLEFRAQHTITRLLDGKILVVGGSQGPQTYHTVVELFDPVTGSFTQVASLHTPRHGHTATLLSDGRILVVGGYNQPQQWLNDAEVYDPNSDTWTVVPPLFSHGVGHTATLLQDGRVLVVGGAIRIGPGRDRVEIFDPQTNTWSEAKPLESDRASHIAQLLGDGRVLVAGGGGGSGIPLGGDAMLYDEQTDTWTATGSMVNPRIFAQSVLLSDGRVLVAGGINHVDIVPDNPNRKMSDSVEIYDPALNGWMAATSLREARYGHVLLLLQDGKVLASGGARDWDCCWNEGSFVSEIEVYDPLIDNWFTVGNLPHPVVYPAAILFPDKNVWLTGGQAGPSWEFVIHATWLISVLLP